MNFSYQLAFIILLIQLPVSVLGQSDSNNVSDDINQIIKATSLGNQMSESAQEFHSQFIQNPFGLEPSKNKRMMELFLDAFDQEALLSDAKKTFRDRYSQQDADSVLSWVNSPQIQKVLSTLKDFYTIQGVRKRVVNQYEIEQNPPDDQRLNIIHSLAQQTSAAETQVATNTTMFRALVKAFDTLSEQQAFSDEQIEGFVDNFRTQIAAQMDQEVSQQLLTMYHGLDDEALQSYVAFYKTDAGHWLKDTSNKTVESAFESAAERFLNKVNSMNSGTK